MEQLIGQNGEAMPEQARSTERPGEPQANGLTALLGDVSRTQAEQPKLLRGHSTIRT
ncbi:MAG: hypothetical protein H6976_10875 [Gammaproteobacteria bacterium]|nr:hypothetical protein [Gammaproteobacteria bacterium]